MAFYHSFNLLVPLKGSLYFIGFEDNWFIFDTVVNFDDFVLLTNTARK